MIQPYPDGVSSRRSSFMAGLSHGKPIVTTYGHLSEPLWNSTDAAVVVPVGDTEACVRCVRRLCEDATERQRVASAALRLYRERFDISHAVAALRQADVAKELACAS
jgi:glycosyltransferase involved in cell wall biosynthesis